MTKRFQKRQSQQNLEPVLTLLIQALEEGIPARRMVLDERQAEMIADLHLITMKKQLYCCNVGDDELDEDNDHVKTVRALAQKDGSGVVVISGKLESEISDLDSPEEKAEFLEAAGLEESGLDQLIREAYGMLGLHTYFTAGEKEVRAETYHCTDLFEYKTELKLKENGKLRVEGKEYVVADGDVLHFRFNV